jgi:hypothetical protein
VGYRARNQGDYRSGYQGGFGLVSMATGLGASIFGRLKRRFAGPAIASAAGVIAAGRIAPGHGVPRLPVPLPGGARLDIGSLLPGGARIDVGSLLPGGKPAFIAGSAAGQVIPRGFRLNKSSYFLKSGQFIPEGTRLVRVRRRNFANGRALRRSIGRVQGFERLVKGSRKSLRKLSKI